MMYRCKRALFAGIKGDGIDGAPNSANDLGQPT